MHRLESAKSPQKKSAYFLSRYFVTTKSILKLTKTFIEICKGKSFKIEIKVYKKTREQKEFRSQPKLNNLEKKGAIVKSLELRPFLAVYSSGNQE